MPSARAKMAVCPSALPSSVTKARTGRLPKRAASAGLLSAQLARGGFSAQPAILEVEQGFASTHACNEPSAAALEAQPEHLLIRDTLFKYHAACYLTHATIEATRLLREQHGVDPEKVFNNLDRYGNTSSASIPLALDEAHRQGRIRRGSYVLFSGFGAGLAWGTVLMRW